MSLFGRVFLTNAVLLTVAALALALTPATISEPIALAEALELTLGLALMLAANFIVLRHTFVPLERLSRRMADVDLLRPGRRLPPTSGEVGELVRSFNAMLERLETERQESAHRVLAAQEAERARVAAELHDEVGQSLTGVLLLLERIAGEVPAGRRETFADAQQAVRRTLDEVRRIAQELRPELLEHVGLVSALTELTTSFADQTGLQVERRFARDLRELTPEAEVAVFRIAQEGLTNVARHAGATSVLVTLEPSRDGVVLRIADDGRGLNGHRLPGGGGLRGMRERAVVIGAALAVKESAAGGVELRLEVPGPPAG